MSKQKLGRGLEAILSPLTSNKTATPTEHIVKIAIDKIKPNRHQPRLNFNEDKLQELAESIKQNGLLEPILVIQSIAPGEYELIAGERRLRASKIAGLKDIKAIVKTSASDKEKLDIALIENIQREDLNAVEEATAFKQLQDEFGLKQNDIAKKVGLSRVAVTNKIRILGLPEEVKEAILNGKITEGHARALLGLSDKDSIVAAMDIVIKRELSVRDTEAMVRKINYGRGTTRNKLKRLDQETEDIANRIAKKLGVQAKIVPLSRGGKITIRFSSKTELRDILKKIS